MEGSIEPHEEGGPLNLETSVGVLEGDGSFFFTFRNLDAAPETDNYTQTPDEFILDSNCNRDDFDASVGVARIRQTDAILIPSDDAHDGLGSIRLEADGAYEVRWIYVDQDVSLLGECERDRRTEETSQVALELTAGWNEIVVTELGEGERNYEVDDRPDEVEWGWSPF